MAHFVISALRGRKITIYGNGKQVRDVLYVEDLVNAFHKFIKSRLPSSVFNMGGGQENTLSLIELIDIIRRKSGHEVKHNYGPWRNSDQKVYVSDISKASEQLKWKLVISAEEGVDRLWKWAERTLKM
ncbi:MAG: GDP-mannose 4,6-dehydratase [Nitrososphaerota archaeon]|nr:GDP-mannose 4,6-dehydratase [Nitrososphaerota archaeon]